MSDNLATILTGTAERLPDQTAFKLDDVELSYSMLDDGSTRVAGFLKSKGLEAVSYTHLTLPTTPYV